MARRYWKSLGATATRCGLTAAVFATAMTMTSDRASAATLSIVSQLDRVVGPHPLTLSNGTDGLAAGNGPSGSQIIRLVWDFKHGSKPVTQNIFGGSFETYGGSTVQVVALDGTPMFDLGSFTVVNFSEYDALALASDTADGIFILRDPDFATVRRQRLGALVAPLLANGNTQVSDFFFRDSDDEVSRITATAGDLVPTAAAPLPAPVLLLGGVLGALGLLRQVRRAA